MSGIVITPGQAGGTDASTALYVRMLGALASMSGDDTYLSPYHFTAVQYSATQVDLAGGFPQIYDVTQISAILQHATDGTVTVFFPSVAVFAWDAANSRITVTGATFATTDVFQVIIRGADRATSLPSNARLTLLGNHYQLNSDDAATDLLPGGAQDFTAAWVDLGSEISMFGYNRAKFYLTFDINDSTDLQFRVLEKHESAGVEEFQTTIESPSASEVEFEPGYWELAVDADALVTLTYRGDGNTPFIQPQIKAGVLGAGTDAQLDAAGVVKSTFAG